MHAHRALLPYRCNMPKSTYQIPQNHLQVKRKQMTTFFLIFENYIRIKSTKKTLFQWRIQAEPYYLKNSKSYLKHCNWENKEKGFRESGIIISY